MPRYMVTAEVTISVTSEVEAATADEARRLAASLELPDLCYQCAGDCEGKWAVDELDGEPTVIDVEQADD